MLKLLECSSTNRERHLEFLAILLNHVEEHLVGWHVGALCYAGDDIIISEIIIIIMVVTDVKEAISLQTERLMYLEIEAD